MSLSTPALSPTAEAVWGIEPDEIQSLVQLRDFTPSQGPIEVFLGSLNSFAAQLLSRHNLKDLYNSNATNASHLALARKKINELEEEVDIGLSENEKLKTRLEMTEKSLLLFQRNASPDASPPDRNTIKIPDPPAFTKGRAEYRTFKAKLKAKLRGDQHRFRNDDHMLEYAMGFLGGEAYETAESLRHNGEIMTVDQLLTYLDSGYEDPDRKGTAQRELRGLRQGSSDFTAHYAKFQAIMAILGWNGEPRMAALEHSLSNEIKDALVLSPTPVNETYAEFVERVKSLDDRLRRRAAEKGRFGGRAPATTGSSMGSKPQGSRSGYSSNPADSTGATPHTGPAPMDLAAKQRWDARQAQNAEWASKGLCTTCGADDHWRRDCPKGRNRRKPPMRAAAAATSTDDDTPPSVETAAPATAESGKE
jgi:hypothetical protein